MQTPLSEFIYFVTSELDGIRSRTLKENAWKIWLKGLLGMYREYIWRNCFVLNVPRRDTSIGMTCTLLLHFKMFSISCLCNSCSCKGGRCHFVVGVF